MRLLCVLLAGALVLFSLCHSRRVSCRRMSWKQRCRKIKKCGRKIPNLEEKCAMLFGEKRKERQIMLADEFDLDFDVILDDHVNDLSRSDMIKLFSAKILSGPTNTTAAVGGVAIFTCTVTGNPAPLTAISPVIASEVSISNFISETIQSNKYVSKVNVTNIISQITKLDEGWYRCGTSNLYGSETRDAYLTVIDPCKGVECGGMDEKCVVNYDTLSAECQCRDYCQEENDYLPSPVCGTDCRTHFNLCSLQQTSCTDQLEIAVLYEGRCEAGIGDITVEVAGYPGPLLYYSGDVIELECDVTGTYTTHISWYKVYQSGSGNYGDSGDPGNRGDKRFIVGRGQTLTLNRALVDDSAMYQCSVSNCSRNVVFSKTVELVVLERLHLQQALTTSKTGPVCSVLSGSRVITFDSSSYSITSPCDYVLAMDCVQASWFIYGRTTRCGDTGVCLESVTMYSGWDVVSLMRGWVVVKGRTGRKVALAQGKEVVVGKFSVLFDGLHVTLILADQVTLTWDGISAAYIQLSNKLTPTCGICGDEESNLDDKTIKMNRQQWIKDETNVDLFAKSWRVDTRGLCRESALLTTDLDKEPDTQPCEDVFDSSVLSKCRRHFPADSYISECKKEMRLKSHVLGDTVPVQCYLGVKFLEMCSLVLNIKVPATLYELGCPSTRFLQQYAVSIGCPQKILPFDN